MSIGVKQAGSAPIVQVRYPLECDHRWMVTAQKWDGHLAWFGMVVNDPWYITCVACGETQEAPLFVECAAFVC